VLARFEQAEEIETAGDSFLIIFGRPSDAVKFALLAQARTQSQARETGAAVLDRIGIHIGEVFIQEREESTKLFGSQVDLCARVMSLGAANQILLTRFVFDNARQVLRGQDLPGVGALRWLNHGLYQLKGIEEPTEICEVRAGAEGQLTPPANSEKAQRYALSEGEPVLGWRPALDQAVPGTKWIIERKLGEGGFGEVWLGRHETLKEKRVFKFCFRADRVRALKREVTLFRVMKEKVGQHPNIVGIQEVFFDEPPYYIVMDYAEAQDVRAWCDAQGGIENVPLATRLEIVAQVADALQAAHQAGVIHRDVKPSNILVSNRRSEIEGQSAETPAASSQPLAPLVKLTDFGIGQVVSQEALAGMTRMGFTQTMVGSSASSQTGTQIYMAPELLAGQAASPPSDIYSLGVVLFQLLAGSFSRPLTTDWARKVSDHLLRQDLEKCFAGDPNERFGSAAELAGNLRSLGKRRTRRTMQRITRAALIASSVTALLVAFGWLILKFSRPSSPGPSLPRETLWVAVRPFSPEEQDKSDGYLSEGLFDEMLRRLQAIASISPVLMTNRAEDPELLAQYARSGVPYLLDGVVQRSKPKIRVSLKLIQTSDGFKAPLELEKDEAALPALPGEMAQLLIQKLPLKLSSVESQLLTNKETEVAEAFDAYLRASHECKPISPDEDRALEFVERATRLDPRFARAYVMLGELYFRKAGNQQKGIETGVKTGSKAAAKPPLAGKAFAMIDAALERDPKLADAYSARGQMYWSPIGSVRAVVDWDTDKAIGDQLHALALNPRLDRAHENLGFVLSHCGLMKEALNEAKEACLYNELNRQAEWIRAQAYLFNGNYLEASNSITKIPENHWGTGRLGEWGLALLNFNLRRTNEAASIVEAAQHKIDVPNATLSSLRAMIYADAGDISNAEKQIEISKRDARQLFHYHHAYYQIGAAYALMHRPKDAIQWLRNAVATGFPCSPYFEIDPSLTNLTNDNDFKALKAELRKKMAERRHSFAKSTRGR
jgi:serine/threonine protein kinase